ncbi:MAG: hypothetical protein CVT95_08350 [Bacteroidetes bacterium HGW-Bacteroidetes-12]|nr:MAG: hypothetical protein CVT95_08350 [Bacteroidetes bacterium HGW-Bacteroidetes-12]
MNIIRLKGGIGNQLFQYAFGCAQKENEITVKYDISSFEGYRHAFRLKYFNVDIENENTDLFTKTKPFKPWFQGSKNIFKKVLKRFSIYFEDIFYIKRKVIYSRKSYDSRLLKVDNKFFDGYWANSKYFQNVLPSLRKDVCIRQEFYNYDYSELRKKIEQSTTPVVSIHIRKGDYLWEENTKIFEEISLDYYYKSLDFIYKRIGEFTLFIFSNDIDWCKTNFKYNKTIVFIDDNYTLEDYHEFELMRLCNHNIIANSTFSWWAAYLNNNSDKIVIAPRIWYANESRQKKHERNGFIPEDWIRL